MARLLIGVSGGIAAYKAIETTRLAVKSGHAVRVIQTPTSERFVGKASFEALTGAPVLSTEFEADPLRGAFPGERIAERTPISHLELVARAELYLIAPATANTIAKLAHGHADTLVSTAALAAGCPVAIAPAMNNRMYSHPATQANLRTLEARGVTIIPPGEGELASHGEYGIGRLAEPSELLAACEALLAPKRWAGTRVLVTAGGTREPIDSVRYIGNRSSGRMGYALAAEAVRRGAEVTVVSANVALDPPAAARIVPVQTASECQRACVEHFGTCDVLLMAAAVADFRPSSAAPGKLKKDQGIPTLELEPTEDVLSALAAERRPGQLLIGFAAEHGAGALDSGAEKLSRKGLDAIVVNDISAPGIGFESAENEVTIITAGGQRGQISRTSKEQIARAVLDEVEKLKEEGTVGAVRADTRRTARV